MFTAALAMMLELSKESGALGGASSDSPIRCWNAFVSQGASNGSSVSRRSDNESNPFQKQFPEKICLNRSMAAVEGAEGADTKISQT